MTPEDIIERYFAAMRQGPGGKADLLALFDDDAVYREPFVDPENPAEGRQAIEERLTSSWQDPPPDMELDVLTVDIDGAGAEVTWECRSPVFDGPVRGVDRYRFQDGRIAELDVRLDRSS